MRETGCLDSWCSAGVQACSVDLSSKCASVEIDESRASVAKAVISAGYSVGGFRELNSAGPQ